MKKALALVLALVLALSMAVSAYAVALKDLTDLTPVEPGKEVVTVVDANDQEVLYTATPGTYYIALEDKAWTDVKVTANGNITAELVEYDPEKMEIIGMDILWAVTEKGVRMDENGYPEYGNLSYDEAVEAAEALNDYHKVTYYGVKLVTNVNIIKITVADNYSAAFTKGTLKIDAKLAGVPYGGTLTVINDVTIFEYEMVKWTAANNAKGAALKLGETGYSDYFTAEYGYDYDDEEYDSSELRTAKDVAVISTTAFRAIAGKNITLVDEKGEMTITIKNVAAGQKGVNFKHYCVTALDVNGLPAAEGEAVAIVFGFYGNQVIASDWTLSVDLGYNWFTLREMFGEKVEEEDILTYYVLKDGKVVKEYKVDYMTADMSENVVLELAGSNSTLGQYEVVLEVPATEGESNPNTGAESVVGVVAALAVVSLASAAAVSLKK